MAGVSTKEIKNRIKSMESTKQITKAMEMVAASKLRRAQTQVADSRPYFVLLQETVQGIVSAHRDLSSPYLQRRPVKKTAWVVIAGDRGLAGGYNSNVLKLAWEQMAQGQVCVLPVGRKCADFFQSRSVSVFAESYSTAETVTVGDCFSMAKRLCEEFLEGRIDAVYIAYTKFESVLSQTPQLMQVLPLCAPVQQAAPREILYEPDCESVFAAIVPEYVGGVLYGCLCESRAAEQAARRTAMDSATQNADEMIADLSLKFNRARQAAITQEITEIVAGV